MKTTIRLKSLFLGLALSGLAVTLPAAPAQEHGAAASATAGGADESAWMAKAKAAYPLDTCVVSGEELEGGSMGGPVDYVYKEAGKPDRLVRFCCKDCVKDFRKNPAKYLKLIDEAAAAKAGHEHHK